MIDKACSKLGACGAGYGWIRCASNVKPCGECGGGVGAHLQAQAGPVRLVARETERISRMVDREVLSRRERRVME